MDRYNRCALGMCIMGGAQRQEKKVFFSPFFTVLAFAIFITRIDIVVGVVVVVRTTRRGRRRR
jgi:hypothetical protein